MTLRDYALRNPAGSAPRTEILAVALLGPRCGPYTNRARSFRLKEHASQLALADGMKSHPAKGFSFPRPVLRERVG